jgi:hypothetical protein
MNGGSHAPSPSLALALDYPLTRRGPEPSVAAAALADEPTVPQAGGLIPSEGDFPRLPEGAAQLDAETLPAQVDLSGDLPPVGSQGMQSSCVGWARPITNRTFLQARDAGWTPTSAVQQFSPAWVYNQRPTDDCSVDGGMSYYSGFRILQDLGAATLAQMPYRAADSCTLPSAAVAESAARYRLFSFANVILRCRPGRPGHAERAAGPQGAIRHRRTAL